MLAVRKNLISVAKLVVDNGVLIEFVYTVCLIKDKGTRKLLLHGELKDGFYQVLPTSNHTSSKVKLACTCFSWETSLFSSQAFSISPFNISLGAYVGPSITHNKTFCITQQSQVSVPLDRSVCFSSFLADNVVNERLQKLVSLDLWHQRLGHPSSNVLQQVISLCKLPVAMKSKLSFCPSCKIGKAHALPFPQSDSHSTKPLELIHSNLWGPTPIPSLSGHRYYLIFVDDNSRLCWSNPLKNKSDVASTFNIVKAFVENQFQTTIKCFQTDGGTEFQPLYLGFLESSINLHATCPYTSQ